MRETNNQLLRFLPPGELKRLLSISEKVQLHAGQVLHHWRLPMSHVYFLEHGLVSVSAKVASDRFVEVWFVGAEGLVGAPLMLTDDQLPPYRRVVQVDGSAWRVSIPDFKRLLANELPVLRKVLMRYLYVVLLQTSQSGACNSIHSIEQRTARWLLLVRNALGSDVVPLTHEVLSRVLGVRRASVTECLDRLQKAGCTKAARGGIVISNARALQTKSCGCFRIIENQYRTNVSSEMREFSEISANGGIA